MPYIGAHTPRDLVCTVCGIKYVGFSRTRKFCDECSKKKWGGNKPAKLTCPKCRETRIVHYYTKSKIVMCKFCNGKYGRFNK